MKRISFGSTSVAVNISQIRIGKNHDFHSLAVELEVLASNNAGPRRNPYTSTGSRTKNLFVAAVTSDQLTESFFVDNNNIIPYLTQEASSPSVIIMKRTLDGGPSPRNYRANYGGNVSSGNSFSLTIDGSSLSNLTIFAGVLTTTLRTRRDIHSLTSMDKLICIRAGQRQETNIVLYTDKAKTNVWVGKAYQDNSGNWFKAVVGRAGSGKLYAVIVPNTKVIFLWDAEKVLNRQLVNLPSVLYNTNKGINSKKAIVQNIKRHSPNYFSSLYTSKIDSGDLALTFAFNKIDFFRNKGLFGDLIQNIPALISSFSLASTKILRKRVTTNRPSNELTGGGANSEYIDSEKIITQTPTFPALAGPHTNVLMVAATDAGAKDLTYGYYAYGVEFVFIDKTSEKIKGLVDDPINGLRFHVNMLTALYKRASLPNNYDRYSRRYTPQWNAAQPGELDSALGAIARYIGVLNVFYKSLESELGKPLQSLQQEIYNMTARANNGPEGINLLIQIINNLISEINNFLKKRNIYGPNSAAELKTGSSRISQGARIIKVKYYFNEFVDAEEFVDYGFDYLATEGSEQETSAYNPFKIVSYEKIRSLLALENTTYNNTTNNAFSPITLTPNFFNLYGKRHALNTTGPNRGKQDAALGSLLAASNLYRNSPIDLAQFMLPDPGATSQSDEFNTIRNGLKMMEHGGCSVEIDATIDDKQRGIFSTYNSLALEEDNNLLDAAKKLSESSPFVVNKKSPTSTADFILSVDNAGQPSQAQVISKLNPDFVAYLTQTDYFVSETRNNSTTIKNITDGKVFRSANNSVSAFLQEVQDQPTPNPKRPAPRISQLLLDDDISPRTPSIQEYTYAQILESSQVKATQTATVAMTIGSTRKTQYLAGFGRLNDSLMLQRPIWIDLTATDINNFAAGGSSILCRFVDQTSQFSPFEGVAAPVYNSMFILSNTMSLPVAPQLFVPESGLVPNVLPPTVTQDDSMSYSTSYIPGTQENRDEAPPLSSQNGDESTNNRESLYTSGKDYILPNGQRYAGYYHIYIRNNGTAIAMVGPTHVGTSHETLKPISPMARRELQLAGRNASSGTGTPATPQGPSGMGY